MKDFFNRMENVDTKESWYISYLCTYRLKSLKNEKSKYLFDMEKNQVIGALSFAHHLDIINDFEYNKIMNLIHLIKMEHYKNDWNN